MPPAIPEDLTSSRRSISELRETLETIYDEVSTTKDSGIPLRDLPGIIQRFEETRGISILTSEELAHMRDMASNDMLWDSHVTLDEFVPILIELIGAADRDVRTTPPSPKALYESESEYSQEDAPPNTSVGLKSTSLKGVTSPAKVPINLPRSKSSSTNVRLPPTPETPASRLPKRSSTFTEPTPPLRVQNRSPDSVSPSMLASRERSSPLSMVHSPELRRPSSSRAAKTKARRESLSPLPSPPTSFPTPPSVDTSPLLFRGARHRPPRSKSDTDVHSTENADPRRHHSIEEALSSMPASQSLQHLASPPIDLTSFRSFPLSPPEENQIRELSAQNDAQASSAAESQPSSSLRETFGANTDFTISVGPGPGTHAAPNAMQELVKKLKDGEDRRTKLAEQHDRQCVELQDRIDELQKEINTKRREEKDIRMKRDQYQSTIAEQEKIIVHLEASISRERDANVESRRRADELQEKTQSLYDELSSKHDDLHVAQHRLQNAKDEHQKLQQALGDAEARITEFERAEEAMRLAQTQSEELRENNEALHEELARLRAELDASQRVGPSQDLEHSRYSPETLRGEIDRSRLLSGTLAERLDVRSEIEDEQSKHSLSSSKSETSDTLRDSFVSLNVPEARHKVKGNATLLFEAAVQTDLPAEPSETPKLGHQPIPIEAPPPYRPQPPHPNAGLFERLLPGLGLHHLSQKTWPHRAFGTVSPGFVFYSTTVFLLGVLAGVALFPTRIVFEDPRWAVALVADTSGAHWSHYLFDWLERVLWTGLERSRRIPT